MTAGRADGIVTMKHAPPDSRARTRSTAAPPQHASYPPATRPKLVQTQPGAVAAVTSQAGHLGLGSRTQMPIFPTARAPPCARPAAIGPCSSSAPRPLLTKGNARTSDPSPQPHGQAPAQARTNSTGPEARAADQLRHGCRPPPRS